MHRLEAYFDRLYQWRSIDVHLPPEERFAGANLHVPADVNSILDVGCGDGQFLGWLSETYLKIGVDTSSGALRRAKGFRVQGSAHTLPFGDASFDLVTCYEVLEHLPAPTFTETLAELERVSRRYIAVSVPNREVLMEGLVWCRRCGCAFHPSWHLRAFDEKSLHTLFTRFRIVECRACGPIARYGDSRLASALVMLAHRPPPPSAQCPQCQCAETPTDRITAQRGTATGAGWVRHLLNRAVRRALFRAHRPYWLLALYIRD